MEYIIAKIDNDFNPSDSDWIPRVGSWCTDALNQLKLLRKVPKKRKLTVSNRIAKSKCCLDDDDLKVYDNNGCEIPRIDESYCGCNDTDSSSTGDGNESEQAIVNDGMPVDCNPNGSRTREVIDTGKVGCNPDVVALTNNTRCPRCSHTVISACDATLRRGNDERNYILADGNTIELNFDADCITIVNKEVETKYSDYYHCEVPVIPNNGILIETLTYYCMYKMLCRNYKHPVFNLMQSQYGTNPYYEWKSRMSDAKTSVLLDEQNEDNDSWRDMFYNATFPKL